MLPVDVHKLAHNLAYHPKQRLKLFRELPVPVRAAVFSELSRRVRQSLILALPRHEAVDLLDHLDPRLASHVLARLESERVRHGLISRLKADQRTKAEHFLSFHPKAALSLIHFNYVLLAEDAASADVAEAIEQHLADTGKIPEVLVQRAGELTGHVPLAALMREPNRGRLRNYVKPIKTVSYQTSKQDIIDAFLQTKHRKLAVVDVDGSVIGIIYSNDVLDLLGGDVHASLYTFAGVEAAERPFDSVWRKVRGRWKWLVLNLGTAFLAAAVVGLFNDLIDAYVLLAIYLPVIAGMGSNAATQTLVIMTRGISMGEISLQNGLPALTREVAAGLVNGAANGLIVAVVALTFNQDPRLGLVAGVATMFSLVLAGFSGTIIPLLLQRLGKDPATGASILITTTTDVTGFLFFLGLASLVLA